MEGQAGTPKAVLRLTRRELYNILKEFKGIKIEEKFTLMEERVVQLASCPKEEMSVVRRSLKFFKTEFKSKWIAAQYMEERFLQNNDEWLKTLLELPAWSDTQKPGRPVKQFNELSDRSKRRRTQDLRDKIPVEELTYAARVKEGTSGNTDTSKMIKDLTASPTRSKKLRKVIETSKKEVPVRKYTPMEALQLFVEGDFTRCQWELIQGANKDIYPCYSLIQKAKKECYPDENYITVSETGYEIKLQGLLDHTASRLCKYLEAVIGRLPELEKQHLLLISK